jgi:hypothetical protein
MTAIAAPGRSRKAVFSHLRELTALVDRLDVVRIALALAALATFLYSAPLWRAHALPPQVPPFAVAPPGWLDFPCFLILLLALGVLLTGRYTTAACLAFLTALLVLSLGDQHRWQPEIQMFAFFAFCMGLGRYRDRFLPLALALMSLYVTVLYAYSGLQKLNPVFTHATGPWLLDPILRPLGLLPFVRSHSLLTPLSALLGCIEASLAVLLWVPALRRGGVVLAVAMHCTLLYVLGSLGHDWNTVVWPWNGFMIVTVPALFWNRPGLVVRPLLRHPVTALAGLALVVYPAGHFAGLTDTYPAHNLYSSFSGASFTCLPPESFAVEPPAWRTAMLIGVEPVDGRAWDCVDTLGWYIRYLGVPPYDAPRTGAALAVAACERLHPSDVLLLESDRPPWLHLGDQPAAGTQRAYRGCDAVRRHAQSGVFGGTPR